MASDQAITAIDDLGTSIDAADAELKAFKYENAVSDYQAAGNQAVAIKPLMNPNPALDQADTTNTQLQALVSHLASQATATQAQTLAKQIQTAYVNAYNSTGPLPVAGGPLAPMAAAPGPISPWLIAGGVLAVAAVGALFLFRGGPKKNPVGYEASSRSRSSKRLIAKGRNVFFDMTDGREVTAHGSMLHDPSGRAWPKNSVLFAPFRRGNRRAPDDDDARGYFGGSYPTKVGSVTLPPRSLAGWQRVGTVERIYYTRGGRSHPGRYEHAFGGRGLLSFFKKGGRATLYRRGRYYRLQLPRDAVVNSRGYVYP